MRDEKVICRTPTEGKTGTTSIAKWKYDCVSAAILKSVSEAGPDGIGFSELIEDVKARLSEGERAAIGSAAWHVTTVKLEMEVRREIACRKVSGAQRLVMTT